MQQPDPLSARSPPSPTHRRAILARLAKGEASVKDLSTFDMTQPAISKHLRVLERAGLIEQGRQAQWRPRRLRAAPLGTSRTGWTSTGATGRRASSGSTPTSGRSRTSRSKRKETTMTATASTGVAPTPRPSIPRAATSSSCAPSTRRASGSGRHSPIPRSCPAGGARTAPTTVDEMDVRAGGKWRYISSAAGREDVTFFGEYLEVDPPRGYQWTFMFDVEGVGPMGGPETFTLEEVDGKTKVTSVGHMGRSRRSRAPCRPAWSPARSRPGTAWSRAGRRLTHPTTARPGISTRWGARPYRFLADSSHDR